MTIGFKQLNLKRSYDSYFSDLTQEFFNPVLSEAKSYSMAAAYFSSSSLKAISKGLSSLLSKGGVMKLIVAILTSKADYEAIMEGKRLAKDIIMETFLDESAMFGWLQVISHDYGRDKEEFSVDIADQFREFMNPFCYYGYKPTMYDAPRHAAPGLRKWKAYTFFCPLSLSNREEYRKITPLAGFTWGYTMSQGKPENILEPMPASRDDWNLVRRNVASYYSQWQFMDIQVPNIR